MLFREYISNKYVKKYGLRKYITLSSVHYLHSYPYIALI